MLSSRERRNKPCKDRKKFSSFIVAALVSNRHCFNPNSKKNHATTSGFFLVVAPQVAPGYMLAKKFSEFDSDHFRCKSPLPFPVKPLMVKPLPVGYFHVPLTWFSIHFCACSIHFCGSNHVCAVRFIFCPVRLILVQLDLFLCVSLYLYAVRFIFVRFDSFVYGSIYFCAGSIQFLCGSIHFLGRSIYFCVVRFFFCCFDICDRFSFYLCAFHIVHSGLKDFVRNGAP